MLASERLAEKIAKVSGYIGATAPIDDNGDIEIEEEFRQCISTVVDDDGDDRYAKMVSCGSAKVTDTAKGLYRLLYLVRPKLVPFDDMYKNRLFMFTSEDGRCLVSVELYKYEIGLYFYAEKILVGGKGSCVTSGYPGADNGWDTTDATAKAFFDLVVKAANSEWDVYPGNDFTV